MQEALTYTKAIVGLAVPLVTALLLGFSSGEWDYENVGYLAGAFITGLLVYLFPNRGDAEDRGRG